MTQPSGDTARLILLMFVVFGFIMARDQVQPTFHEATDKRMRSVRAHNPLIFGDLIDPNRASLETLMTLPGVGEVIANNVLRERDIGGDFQTSQGLLRVTGIGPAAIENISDLLVIESPEPPPPPRLIDLNCATVSEIERLPNIGPVLARRVVDFRALHGPFRSNSELKRVRGIGPVLLKKASPSLTVRPTGAVCSRPH